MPTVSDFRGNVFVQLYPAQIENLLHGIDGPVFRNMIVRAERVKTEAIKIAPRRTGNLASHIVKRVVKTDRGPGVLVGVENVKYAIWVHEGAKPHPIDPVNGPFLVFFWPKVGHVVRLRHVNHPGNKPNRFLVRALRAAV